MHVIYTYTATAGGVVHGAKQPTEQQELRGQAMVWAFTPD